MSLKIPLVLLFSFFFILFDIVLELMAVRFIDRGYIAVGLIQREG